MSPIDVLVAAIGIALGVMFAMAGVAKLRAPRTAFAAVDAWGLLKTEVARWLAMPLALVELLSGAMTIWPSTRALGGASIVLLLLVFIVAIVEAIARGRGGEDCGCGGLVGGVPIGWPLLARNVMLLCAALVLVLYHGAAPRSMLQWTAAGCGALLLVAGFALLDYRLARARQLEDD